MVRRFSLSDILLVKRLQGQGVCLDLETALLWSPAPLWMALIDYLSLNEARTSTFVQDESSSKHRTEGFLQAWDRADRLACDVVCVAPSLREAPATSHLWHELLEYLCEVKGQSGMRRVFARVSEDEPATDVFRGIGFSTYGRRHIFRLPQLPPGLHSPGPRLLRPLQKAHTWGLEQLRNRVIPRAVQQAEGGIRAERDFSGLVPWWKSVEIKEHVLANGDGVQAYVRFVAGEAGHWLRIILRPDAGDQIDRILSEALLMASTYPPRPIYCDMRGYESGLQGALAEMRFEPLATELLMVKHTTVRAGVPVTKLGPALEKHIETATPVSGCNSYEEAL